MLVFLLTESLAWLDPEFIGSWGSKMWKNNLHRAFIQHVWINIWSMWKFHPDEITAGIQIVKTSRNDTGVKDKILIPEGVKKKRNHNNGDERKKDFGIFILEVELALVNWSFNI